METDLQNSRLEICRNCPLYKVDSIYGPVCDSSKYINVEDKTSISFIQKTGYVKGCGCKLNWKSKNPKAHCIVKKW